jgi:daunorubicin resistance ABC transporter ATP-binding subunit
MRLPTGLADGAQAPPGPAGQPAIRATGLVKAYSQNAGLFGVDLAVDPGSVAALLGPNGAGKTTAIRIMCTLLKPDAGQVTVGGYDTLREPAKVRSVIGITGQGTSVDERLTGAENLTMFARLSRLGKHQARARCRDLLESFGLSAAAGRPVKSYSGGMRRKLDLAVSLVVAPLILFLDEPTTGLDLSSRGAVWDMVRGLVGDGSTVLLTTQQLDEADALADRVVLIDHGRVVATGSPAELKAQAGQARLELTTETDSDYSSLEALVGATAAGNATRRTVSIPIDDNSPAGLRDLHQVIDRVCAAGITVGSYRIQHATLDDVFRRLVTPAMASDQRPPNYQGASHQAAASDQHPPNDQPAPNHQAAPSHRATANDQGVPSDRMVR